MLCRRNPKLSPRCSRRRWMYLFALAFIGLLLASADGAANHRCGFDVLAPASPFSSQNGVSPRSSRTQDPAPSHIPSLSQPPCPVSTQILAPPSPINIPVARSREPAAIPKQPSPAAKSSLPTKPIEFPDRQNCAQWNRRLNRSFGLSSSNRRRKLDPHEIANPHAFLLGFWVLIGTGFSREFARERKRKNLQGAAKEARLFKFPHGFFTLSGCLIIVGQSDWLVKHAFRSQEGEAEYMEEKVVAEAYLAE